MIGQLGMATRDTEWIGEQELKLRESSHISGALHAALQGHFEDGFTGHSRRGHPVTLVSGDVGLLMLLSVRLS